MKRPRRRDTREVPQRPAAQQRSISPDDVARALPARWALPLEAPVATPAQQLGSGYAAAAESLR